MLCRSIAVNGLENIKGLINGAEMAEVRIEKSGLDANEVKTLFASHPNLVATCRANGITDNERTLLLASAVEGGAKWIDIEVEAPYEYTQNLVNIAAQKGCKVIISYHNYEVTPDAFLLCKVVNECRKRGADLVKVATIVNQTSDISRLMCLYSQDIPMLAIGMGKMGAISRVAAIKMGAPFTFVSCDNEAETAPGQIQESKMKELLNIL